MARFEPPGMARFEPPGRTSAAAALAQYPRLWYNTYCSRFGRKQPMSSAAAQDATSLIDEGARRLFESAWAAGHPKAIEDCLPPADHPSYRATLQELIYIEMELAWKAHRQGAQPAPARVEDYLARFPCLEGPGAILRLVK